jgi:hypothetical protein
MPTSGLELLHGPGDGRLRQPQHGGSLHRAAQGLDGASSAQTFEVVQGSSHKNFKHTHRPKVTNGLNGFLKNGEKNNAQLLTNLTPLKLHCQKYC